MEIRDIRYFKMVAEYGNVARAADALGLSTTALSKSLRRLEKSLGAKLVKRTSRGVGLTAVGNALIARAGTLQLALDDIHREAADLGVGRAGHINVGTVPGLLESKVTDAYCTLLQEAPNVSLKATVVSGNQIASVLQSGQVDFTVNTMLAAIPKDIAYEYLFSDYRVVCAAANHPLARRKRVTLADLAKERWASDVNATGWKELCRLFELERLEPPRLLLESHFVEMKRAAIASSNLLMIGSAAGARKAGQYYPIVELAVQGLTIERRLGVYYRRDGYLSPAAKRMIEILKEQGKAITAGKGRQA